MDPWTAAVVCSFACILVGAITRTWAISLIGVLLLLATTVGMAVAS